MARISRTAQRNVGRRQNRVSFLLEPGRQGAFGAIVIKVMHSVGRRPVLYQIRQGAELMEQGMVKRKNSKRQGTGVK